VSLLSHWPSLEIASGLASSVTYILLSERSV
jgi:hypothetical protein